MKHLLFYSICIFLVSCEQNITKTKLVQSKIIDGDNVKEGYEVKPHVVALLDIESNSLCSGTIIKNNIILTAAHCISNKKENLLVIFETELNSASSSPNSLTNKTREVLDVITHDNYIKGYGLNTNDVALVKIKGEIPNDYSPISYSKDATIIHKNSIVRVVGYGVNSFELTPIDVTDLSLDEIIELIKINKIVCDFENLDCYYPPKSQGVGILRQTSLKVTSLESNDFYTDDKYNGICSGDSGGPSLIKIKDQFVVVGVSIQTESPMGICNGVGLHLNVGAYASWIDEKLKILE